MPRRARFLAALEMTWHKVLSFRPTGEILHPAQGRISPSGRNDVVGHIVIKPKRGDPLSKTYYVYLLTNWNNKVMYVGMTNNLKRRVYEHKHKLIKGFTAKYNVNKLVYFEQTSDVRAAIAREKEIKKWRREKKNRLVEKANPEWKDLSTEWD
jgi:putative endonuclease